MYDTMPPDWLCCAYLRKSREDEERDRHGGDTLARHEQIVERMARENGHVLREKYREVVSGETISGRPEVKRMLADIAHNKWDAVYVVESSRLGRGGGSDQEKIINALKYTNTWLVSRYKVYNPQSPSDMRQLKSELRSSEDELESISQRLKLGKYESAREGRWQSTGRTPYGWKAVRINGLWQLRPDENHKNMLRIYDMLEAGMGIVKISNVYNDEHIPTAHGGYHWTAAAVREVAKNPANCGYVRFGYHLNVKEFDPETFEVKKRRALNPEPLIVKGLHFGTGGIDKERFDRIMAKMTEESRKHQGLKLVNPLAGILVCGKCGYSMNIRKTKRGHRYYYHKVERLMTRPCEGCHSARFEMVMDVLSDALRKIMHDAEISMEVETEKREYEEHMAALERGMARAEEAKARAMQAYEAGVYSLEELRASKSEADATIEKLKQEIAKSKPPKSAQETITTVKRCIELLEDDSIEAQAKNDLLKTMIERIDYYNDTPKWKPSDAIRLDIFLR